MRIAATESAIAPSDWCDLGETHRLMRSRKLCRPDLGSDRHRRDLRRSACAKEESL